MNKYENRNICKLAKKIKSINYLGGECQKCGEKNIFKMTFHHKDPKEKEINFNDYKSYRWSFIQKELDKCELLCQNCHRQKHFIESKSENSIRRMSKLIFLQYMGGKCFKCDYDDCPSALTFHHRIKSTKSFSIGNCGKSIRSITDILGDIKEELDKCDILCMNCHILEHSNIEFYEKYKDKIIEKSINYKEKQNKLDHDIIISLYKNGMRQCDISKMFSSSKGAISGIIKKSRG